jgi:hypothetical protein
LIKKGETTKASEFDNLVVVMSEKGKTAFKFDV